MFRFIGPTPSGSGMFRSSRHGMPQDRPASMNAAATGWRSRARSTRIGPPAPRKVLAPPSQSSDFLNRGNTEKKSQNRLPAFAQLS
jgi:hypothetical protein